MALEDDVQLMRFREILRELHTIGLHVGAGDAHQAREFAGVRRDDDVAAFGSHQLVWLADKRIERVRVEHQRHARTFEQAMDERDAPAPSAKTGACGNHVGRVPQDEFQGVRRDAVEALVEPQRHVLRSHRRDHCHARAWRGDGDQPRAGLECAHRRQVRRAGLAR